MQLSLRSSGISTGRVLSLALIGAFRTFLGSEDAVPKQSFKLMNSTTGSNRIRWMHSYNDDESSKHLALLVHRRLFSRVAKSSIALSDDVEIGDIHPTAIVHPDAFISNDVTVGAFCTIGCGVKIGGGCKLHTSSHIFGNTEIGENCTLLTGAVVGCDIPGKTVIGNNNTIGYHAVVGVKCQDMKYKEGDECYLEIGNDNDIREHVSVHRSSKRNDSTIIGNKNLIMGSCHVAHDVKLGNNNILANGTLLGGHVIVQNFVHTGGAVAVHQFCHIDSFSFLAGGSMVDRDVPMYMMVAGDRAELRGLNLEGMRRCGFSDAEVKCIRRAYQKLFMSSDGGLEQRMCRLELDEELKKVVAVSEMIKSLRNCFTEKRRGICNFRCWTNS